MLHSAALKLEQSNDDIQWVQIFHLHIFYVFMRISDFIHLLIKKHTRLPNNNI